MRAGEAGQSDRSATVGAASVRSSRSGPLSSRFSRASPRVVAATFARPDRNGPIRSRSTGCATTQVWRSTTSVLCNRCSPTVTSDRSLSAARSIRRRSPGGVRAGGRNVSLRVAGPAQGGFQQSAFPFDVLGVAPVLQGAAAADAEMRAGRFDPCRARLKDGLGLARKGRGSDALPPCSPSPRGRRVGAGGPAGGFSRRRRSARSAPGRGSARARHACPRRCSPSRGS